MLATWLTTIFVLYFFFGFNFPDPRLPGGLAKFPPITFKRPCLPPGTITYRLLGLYFNNDYKRRGLKQPLSHMYDRVMVSACSSHRTATSYRPPTLTKKQPNKTAIRTVGSIVH